MDSIKRLLYFLIGFTLPFLAYSIAYSHTCGTDSLPSACITDYAGAGGEEFLPYATFLGIYSTDAEATAVRDAANSGYKYFYTYSKTVSCGGVTTVVKYAKAWDENWHPQLLPYSFYETGCAEVDLDTDDDGLPDECDFYPNDGTPYSVKLLTYFTDDGTESGHVTFQIWQTDRGDWFEVGEEPADLNSGFFVGGSSAWTTPDCGSDILSGPASPSDPNKVISQPPVSTGVPSGDAPTDTDPTLQPGKKSDGTETGDAALRDIIDNTGDIATNTKRLGEYAKSLNSAIQNMDRNITIAEERAVSQELDKMQDELDAESAEINFGNYDVEGALSGQIDPSITEGPEGDYQDHGPLSEETWVTEFISSNPISTVLGESGFQSSNSRCTADLNLGYLGQHSIDICDLEPQFITFGQLLVALVTLTGLVHVVTGRGF